MKHAITLVWSLMLLTWFSSSLQAQTTEQEPCGTMPMLDRMIEQNPAVKSQMDAHERHTAEFIRSYKEGTNRMSGETIVIPVVFHVIYNTPAQNISDAQLLDQLRVLNEDFRRMNADTSNTPAVFDSVAADINVEFCLATVDPDGNTTTGITRTLTNVSTWGFQEEMKFDSTGGHDAWPRDDYLNFWVVNFSGGLLGFAQFPASSGIGTGAAETDGVVCDYQFTGSIEAAANTNYGGRVGTHEVGHWLNLRHVWGDGDCSVDDFVDDTPLSSFPSGDQLPCTFPGSNTCNTGPDDLPNMFQNYMDYGDGLCQNLFTEGQKLRMLATLAPGGDRESIVSALGCCPSTSCPRPNAQSIVSLDDSSAMITWTDPTGVINADIRYRAIGDTAWITGFGSTNGSLMLTGLDLCTRYEVQVRSFCASDSSSFCITLRVETEGCCRAPVDAIPSTVEANTATVNWTSVFGAFQYDVQYRPLGSMAWLTTTTADTFAQLAALAPCKGYEYQLKPKCDTLGNVFSAIDTFYTEGCEACALPDYCQPGGVSNINWIDSVSLGPIQSQSGPDVDGYLDFGVTSSDILIDSTYDFFLKRGGAAVFPRKWGIWLDLNQDGDFDDVGEELFLSTAIQDTEVVGSITLGPLVQTGRTRLRIGSLLSFNPNVIVAPCDTNISGEYEDYCLNLVAPCAVPQNFFATLDSADSSVFVFWQSAPYSDSFLLDYRPLNDTVWESVAVGDLGLYQLTTADLNSCTEYELRLRTVCGDSSSFSSALDTVVTLCKVGIDPRLARAIKLYPNPATNQWTIEAPVQMTGIKVFDLYGRKTLDQATNAQRLRFETPEWVPGMYLIQIETDQGTLTRRLIIRN